MMLVKATKHNAWEFMYEDCLDLISKLPEIGAYIYRMKYKGDTPIPSDPDLDFGDDFAHMMGIDSEYADAMRLYFYTTIQTMKVAMFQLIHVFSSICSL